MSEISVTVKPSFASIASALKSIDIGRKLQRGITLFAEAIRDEAVKQTPVDTGRLRASIGTSIGLLRAVVAPHVKYAFWIHEGWEMRGGKKVTIKGRGRAGTPPGGKPFMRFGMEKVNANQDRFFTQELAKEIDTKLRVLK